MTLAVIPARAGIRTKPMKGTTAHWISAFAEMTEE